MYTVITNTVGHLMTDSKIEPQWGTAPPKPKDVTVSDMIHQDDVASPKPAPGHLRDYMVERTMARHGFTEEQALALILAFGRYGCAEAP